MTRRVRPSTDAPLTGYRATLPVDGVRLPLAEIETILDGPHSIVRRRW